MKPVKLIMSAFGSYAGEEVIDFRQADRGVFLITGDTGAGKTTIFDAITYALYDQTSGGKREGVMMRSQYASPQTPTYVELTFSYQGKCYTVRRNPSYSRISKRKNKEGELTFTTEAASVTLTMPDGQEYPGKMKEINEKIIEILGVGKEQFTQIAMIAQGEFIRLLHASSKERKEIFGKIFDTGVYGRLQQQLREKSRTLYGHLEDNRKLCVNEIDNVQYDAESDSGKIWEESRNLLESNPGQILKSLGQIIKEQEETEKQLEKQAAQLRKEQEECSFRLRQAQEINQLFAQAREADEQIQNRKENLENLKQQENHRQEDFETLKQHCQERIPVLTEQLTNLKILLPKYARLRELEQETAQAKQQRERLEQELQRQAKQVVLTEAAIEKLETENQNLTQETARLPELVQKEKELSERQKRLEEMEDTARQLDRKKADLTKGQEKLQNFLKVYKEKSQAYDEKYSIFIEEQAGFLAQSLEEGKPCPVCGSLVHPRKAEFSRKPVSKEQLEKAKKERESADRKLQEYQEQYQKLQAECMQQQAVLEQDGQRMFGAEFATEQITPELQTCREEHGQAVEELARGKQQEKLLERQKQQLENSRERLSELKERQEELKSRQYEASLAYETKEQARKTLQEELPFETEDELKTQLTAAEQEKLRLETRQAKIEQSLQKLREDIAANQGTLMEQQKNRELLSRQLEGKEPMETIVLTEQVQKLEQKAQELDREKRSLTSKIDRNREAKTHLSERYQERERYRKQYELVGNLDRTANGNLAQHARMDLQTYVQRRYFKYIIGEANRRLMKMNGEQFFLQCREIENLGKQGEVGLDLDVYDLVTDKVRDVKTLSGGESFLAALAMALGMADVIQKTAGKVHLDTMFIDEGFGSLDEEARRRAIGILNELAGDTRLVGIISHVTELKEQMDRKLVISKSDRGSHSAWVIES